MIAGLFSSAKSVLQRSSELQRLSSLMICARRHVVMFMAVTTSNSHALEQRLSRNGITNCQTQNVNEQGNCDEGLARK